jgi:hypothetical protein
VTQVRVEEGTGRIQKWGCLFALNIGRRKERKPRNRIYIKSASR